MKKNKLTPRQMETLKEIFQECNGFIEAYENYNGSMVFFKPKKDIRMEVFEKIFNTRVIFNLIDKNMLVGDKQVCGSSVRTFEISSKGFEAMKE